MNFLDSAINLLDGIHTSSQKRDWGQEYSVYSRDIGASELKNSLLEFQHKAYEFELVITNYHEIIEEYKIDEDLIDKAETDWIATLPAQCVLACIAWHFRRDHFCEGSLINKSIASGAMLRLLQRLKEFYP